MTLAAALALSTMIPCLSDAASGSAPIEFIPRSAEHVPAAVRTWADSWFAPDSAVGPVVTFARGDVNDLWPFRGGRLTDGAWAITRTIRGQWGVEFPATVFVDSTRGFLAALLNGHARALTPTDSLCMSFFRELPQHSSEPWEVVLTAEPNGLSALVDFVASDMSGGAVVVLHSLGSAEANWVVTRLSPQEKRTWLYAVESDGVAAPRIIGGMLGYGVARTSLHCVAPCPSN